MAPWNWLPVGVTAVERLAVGVSALGVETYWARPAAASPQRGSSELVVIRKDNTVHHGWLV